MDTHRKLIDLMRDFDTAMLVTRSGDGSLDSRPMVVVQVEEDGQLWFVTDRDSGKIVDLTSDSEVAITMQCSDMFVSRSGVVTIVDDQSKLDELWREAWKVWFTDGISSESIILIRIEPTHGEYWDNSGIHAVKYLLKAGTAYLQGKTPESDASTKASVSL